MGHVSLPRVVTELLLCACIRSVEDSRLAASVTRKRDIKQFRQACKEVGLTAQERYAASEALHAEKDSSGMQEHMSYGELLAWLRQWRQR